MCGRYKATPGEFADLKVRFNLEEIPLFKPRYNIAPTPSIEGVNRLELFQWGLVPSWAKDVSIGNRMINARAENLAEKPSFKRLLNNRRCLVLADGFYESRKEGKGKVPMWFKLKSGEPFVFAGLWDMWKQPDGTLLRTYTIVTTEPNEVLMPIHNRMPVIYDREMVQQWLERRLDTIPRMLPAVLQPFRAELMEAHDVLTLVKSPANDTPKCIERDS